MRTSTSPYTYNISMEKSKKHTPSLKEGSERMRNARMKNVAKTISEAIQHSLSCRGQRSNDEMPQLNAVNSPSFKNYNVRYHGDTVVAYAWAEAKNMSLKIFQNYDGGGFNFYICEFETLDAAVLFCTDFSIGDDRAVWAEDDGGEIHYF